MKIVFLNIFNGIVSRGSENFVSELAGKLFTKYDIEVFQTGKTSNKSYREIQISGIPYIPYQLLNNGNSQVIKFILDQSYHFLVFIFTLKCLIHLRNDAPDWIVPINGRFQVVLCRIYRKFNGSKIMITGHAGIGFEDKFNIQFGKPDIFVALSQKAFTWSKNIDPQLHVIYIPNGVNLDIFSPKVKPVTLNVSRPIILCVSALLDYKRIQLLIEAVARLPQASLVLIGDGELRLSLVKMGKKILDQRFLYFRRLNFTDLPNYYRTADIFSLPSKESEAFGLVYLEALACNIPVVAPDDMNRRNIIGNAGLYCDPTKIDDYAGTLKKALKRKFGNLPRKQSEKFSWDSIALQYSKLFDTVNK